MISNNFRLITLGRTTLLQPDGRPEATLGPRRRKLAVLAYLAAARRPVQRQVLLEMFWGGQEEERARHSLSDALSHLRRVLGPTSISSRRTEIAWSEDAPLVVDATELVRSAAGGDYGRVLELYEGPYLAGVEVESSPGFESWVMRERERLRGLVVEAAELHARSLAERGDWAGAAEASRRWLEAEPLSADAAVALLEALTAPATREGYRRAISEYRQLCALLSREYDWEPDDRVSALAARIAREAEPVDAPDDGAAASWLTGGVLRTSAADPDGSAAEPGTPASATGDGAPAPQAPEAPRQAPDGHRARGRRLWPAVVVAAMLCLLVASAVLAGLRREAAPVTSAAVAILDVRNLTGAPDDSWLEQGLSQMIGADLFRAGGLDVVPPERVREVRRRGDASAFAPAPLTLGQALDLARRLGARTIVRGGFSHGGGVYVLDLTVYDVARGRPVQMLTVRDTSVLRLADAAAARLEGALGVAEQGVGVAEVETPSLEAYRHYIAALQARDEGRYPDAAEEVAAALAADSQFVAALRLKASMAAAGGDAGTERDALAAAGRASSRATPYDRLDLEVSRALLNGERGRPVALARELVRRYPRDPRAYRTLASALFAAGSFAEQEAVLRQALDLDSLGMEAGQGPCVPCVGYGGLAEVRSLRGDMEGAVAAARRWVQLQPDVPAAWVGLGSALSMAGDFRGAEDAQRRAAALEPGLWLQNTLVRTWLMAGRYEDVDSAVAAWERMGTPEAREATLDLRAMLERERGQFRAAARTLRGGGAGGGIPLVLANTLAHIGDLRAARAIYEESGHPRDGTSAQRARGFCWAHALEAEDLADAGDTTRLRALADSLDAVSQQSYYARDWRLSDHVRGLLALSAGRYEEAERDLSAARFGVAGWTATNLALAHAQMALNRPRDAIITLRQALEGPLDGMGRYVPRSEIAYQLAQAYWQAGDAASARRWAAAVRRAWTSADPSVRARLSSLP